MKYVKEFGIILIVSLVGELLNYFLPLPVPASIYGLVLMFMVVNAFSLGISAASESVRGAAAMTLTLGLGSACFAASDIVLATDFFSGGKDIKKKKANIILYYSGQMLMAASLFATVLVK